jgi:hypothetical protein
MEDLEKIGKTSKRISSKHERKKAKEFRKMRQSKSQRFMESVE